MAHQGPKPLPVTVRDRKTGKKRIHKTIQLETANDLSRPSDTERKLSTKDLERIERNRKRRKPDGRISRALDLGPQELLIKRLRKKAKSGLTSAGATVK